MLTNTSTTITVTVAIAIAIAIDIQSCFSSDFSSAPASASLSSSLKCILWNILYNLIRQASGGCKKDGNKDDILEVLKTDLEGKAHSLAQVNDNDINTAIGHIQQVMVSIHANPDTCATQALSALSDAELDKINNVLGGGNANYKFEAIMKVLFAPDNSIMKRKELALTNEFQALTGTTQYLLLSQFASDKGEMTWLGKGSLSSEITRIRKALAKAEGRAEAEDQDGYGLMAVVRLVFDSESISIYIYIYTPILLILFICYWIAIELLVEFSDGWIG